MRRLVRYLLQGVMLLVPVGITIYVIVRVAVAVDENVHAAIASATGWQGRGLGWPIVLGALFIAGWLMDIWLFKRVWGVVESGVGRIPLVKSVYGAVRDTLGFLFGEKQSFSKVVLVELPGAPGGVLGMVTNEKPAAACGDNVKGLVVVYLPMAFNLGGYTVFVPPEKLKPLAMTVEEAMSFVITGGMAKQNGK